MFGPGEGILYIQSGISYCPHRLPPSPPTEGNWPPAITICLTNQFPIINFSISDDCFGSCLTQLAMTHSSPDLNYANGNHSLKHFHTDEKQTYLDPQIRSVRRNVIHFIYPHNLKIISQNTFQGYCMSGSEQLFLTSSVSSE